MENINLVLGISNVVCGLLVGGMAIPLIKGKVKMNHYYGVRFTKSYESEENWYRINRHGGVLLLKWSVLVLLFGLSCFVLPKIDGVMLWIYGLAPLVYIVACVQSFLYARKL